jgi:hypothetical protein
MRSLTALTTAVALVIAGFPTVPSYGQSAVMPVRADSEAPNPAVVSLFKAHPQGGERLSKEIADLIVSNPKLAPNLARYVVNSNGLNNAQKKAAERGMAAAMERLGINAADMEPPIYTKAPVVEEAFNPLWLLAAAAAVGLGVCAAVCGCFRSCGGPPPATQHGGVD